MNILSQFRILRGKSRGGPAERGPLLAPALEQVLLADLADEAAGHAHHDAARRHVARDDGPGRDEGLLADLDAGRDHDAPADPAGAAEAGSAHRRLGSVAAHRVVVGRGRAGPDEDVVGDGAEGRQVDARLDAHARADLHVVVDHAPPPDHGARADRRALAHERLVAEDRPGADLRAREDDRAGADRDVLAQLERIDRADGGGVRGQARALAEHRVVLDRAAVADHRAVVDDDERAEADVLADPHAGAYHGRSRLARLRAAPAHRRQASSRPGGRYWGSTSTLKVPPAWARSAATAATASPTAATAAARRLVLTTSTWRSRPRRRNSGAGPSTAVSAAAAASRSRIPSRTSSAAARAGGPASAPSTILTRCPNGG